MTNRIEEILDAHEARMKRLISLALRVGAAIGGFIGALLGWWLRGLV